MAETPAPRLVDAIFVSSGDPAEDSLRLDRLVLAPVPVARILVVVEAEPAEDLLARRLITQPIPWLALRASSNAEGVNRALLLCERDVVILPPYATPDAGCFEELLEVAYEHDRVAAAFPAHVQGAVNERSAHWLRASSLPRATDAPAPDIGLALLRHDVISLIGGLDTGVGGYAEALADWCMRAQRMGLVTRRALRALAVISWNGPVACPRSKTLSARHRAYDVQVDRAGQDPAAHASRWLLSAKAGRLSVCLDIRYLPEDAINGSSVYAVELCRALKQHTPARLSLLVASEVQRRALAPLDVPIYVEGQHVPGLDVVHRPAQVFRPWDLRWLLRAPGALVISYQDLIAYRASSTQQDGAQHELYRLVSHLALRSSQAVLAISEHARQDLLREFALPEAGIGVVHHGVRAEDFATRDEPRNQAVLRGLGVRGPYFFCVGSDYAHKNLRLTLAAYLRFRARTASHGGAVPDLVLVGHPSGTADGLFPRLRAESPPGVRYLGDVSNEQLRALYQESLALLFLSAYEGFGLPILEAMAARTPVLCSRFASIPEVAGDAACYVDTLTDESAAAAMAELSARPELRKSLIERGAARAAQFTWEATARKTYALYEQAVLRPAPRSLVERRINDALVERLMP